MIELIVDACKAAGTGQLINKNMYKTCLLKSLQLNHHPRQYSSHCQQCLPKHCPTALPKHMSPFRMTPRVLGADLELHGLVHVQVSTRCLPILHMSLEKLRGPSRGEPTSSACEAIVKTLGHFGFFKINYYFGKYQSIHCSGKGIQIYLSLATRTLHTRKLEHVPNLQPHAL